MDAEAGLLRCPSCGGPCSPDARVCPHCDVEIASVRCAHCFALHFVGSRFCARCGKELAPEPVLDAVDAPCPRCAHPLSVAAGGSSPVASGEGLFECTACGGIFAGKAALDRILAGAARPDVAASPPDQVADNAAILRGAHAGEPVRYLKCPLCSVLMNRVHFAHHSRVVVSVCKPHGTWFDAGELTEVIEFVARGA